MDFAVCVPPMKIFSNLFSASIGLHPQYNVFTINHIQLVPMGKSSGLHSVQIKA